MDDNINNEVVDETIEAVSEFSGYSTTQFVKGAVGIGVVAGITYGVYKLYKKFGEPKLQALKERKELAKDPNTIRTKKVRIKTVKDDDPEETK